MYEQYTGVVLKKFPIGEADELLTIYTKEVGKLRVKSRSSRKIRSRLAGNLQSLNEIEFETAGGRGRTGVPVLVSVSLISRNAYLREDLKKFAWALVGTETLYRMTPDGQSNQPAYQDFVSFLKELGASDNAENVCVRKFQLKLLERMGFGMNFKEMSVTAEERRQIKGLLSNNLAGSLQQGAERVIERYLEEVLEREIKSKKFVSSLN